MGYESVSRSRMKIAGSLLGLGLLAAPLAATMAAEVTVGAGMRASFATINFDGAEGFGDDFSEFSLDDARLYINGKVTDSISFMTTTQLTSGNDNSNVNVLDAAAQFSFGMDQHIWAGRFLAPSDRANLYGPYYQNAWFAYVDGIQDHYSTSVGGRDEGVMWWGQFGMAKISAGVFNNTGIGDGDVKVAARAQYNFWDAEDGYYLNGSYYGAKNLLSVGLATQFSSDDKRVSLDVLMEKKFGGGGVLTLEAEAFNHEWIGEDSDNGWYGLAAYMFAQEVGMGKFQVLAKYGNLTFDDGEAGDSDTDNMELNLNYIIKDQNARIQLFYLDNDQDFKVYGVGLQIQM